MRSVFSAGLLDGFINADFNPFDFYIGVSAGAYNLVAFLSGTPRASLRIFEHFATNREFINFWRFFRGGHLIDLDWLERFAFDLNAIHSKSFTLSNRPLYVGVTDVITGKPVYIKVTTENMRRVIKASAALPLFYREFPRVNGRLATDGGVSESIPVAEAIRLGATRIMVVRARYKDYMKKDTLIHQYVRRRMKQYPRLHETLTRRVAIHRDVISLIHNPPAGVSIIEVCPPENFTLGRFGRNRHRLFRGYQLGEGTAANAIKCWKDEMDTRQECRQKIS